MSKCIAKFKEWLSIVTYSIHPRLYLTLSYIHNRGSWPNLNNPQNLSEIIISKMISGEINKVYPYVDKVKVRDYLIEWGLGEYLPNIYGVWKKDEFDKIDFSKFPNKFALKSNNGCGSHYICRDKLKMSVDEAKSILTQATTSRTWSIAETHYALIEPQIYCEEFLEDPTRGLPLDYKFMCCDGEIRCVLVCVDRDNGTKLVTYSTEWEKLDYIRSYEKYHGDIDRPLELEKMIKIVKQIAPRFEYIRVDMYNIGHKVYIGELTFTPEGGIMKYFTNRAIQKLGHIK